MMYSNLGLSFCETLPLRGTVSIEEPFNPFLMLLQVSSVYFYFCFCFIFIFLFNLYLTYSRLTSWSFVFILDLVIKGQGHKIGMG